MTIWQFHKDGDWTKTSTDFLHETGLDDLESARIAAGFAGKPSLVLGDDVSGSFCIRVFRRNQETSECGHCYTFLVAVDVGDEAHYVVAQDLPDLFAFLQQAAPLAISIDDWVARCEKDSEEAVKKRLGFHF